MSPRPFYVAAVIWRSAVVACGSPPRLPRPGRVPPRSRLTAWPRNLSGPSPARSGTRPSSSPTRSRHPDRAGGPLRPGRVAQGHAGRRPFEAEAGRAGDQAVRHHPRPRRSRSLDRCGSQGPRLPSSTAWVTSCGTAGSGSSAIRPCWSRAPRAGSSFAFRPPTGGSGEAIQRGAAHFRRRCRSPGRGAAAVPGAHQLRGCQPVGGDSIPRCRARRERGLDRRAQQEAHLPDPAGGAGLRGRRRARGDPGERRSGPGSERSRGAGDAGGEASGDRTGARRARKLPSRRRSGSSPRSFRSISSGPTRR